MMTAIKQLFRPYLYKLLTMSLSASNSKKKRTSLKKRLEEIIPDITGQYTNIKFDGVKGFRSMKTRSLHTFQMSFLIKSIKDIFGQQKRSLNIVDIGDSSGNHLIYLNSLAKDQNLEIRSISVNLDKQAVDKISKKGLEAICCRAEEVHKRIPGLEVDLFMSFEMVEHLLDPASFMRSMAKNSNSNHMVITVPYVKNSRVGLHHLRAGDKNRKVYAEECHIFELSPEDWNLLFEFSGWKVVICERFTQYPKWHILSWTKFLWRKFDFDGFYGVLLEKDTAVSDNYMDWPEE
ncbi:hypothetical protein OAT67_04885 [Bacteriovoracaceae bacterium]|nr:hypothetical protein [Bacteriovoracaceae bacterium]